MTAMVLPWWSRWLPAVPSMSTVHVHIAEPIRGRSARRNHLGGLRGERRSRRSTPAA
jgi:hypothetical protein